MKTGLTGSTLRIRRETTVQQVIVHLKELIASGQWGHGQKLPAEKELVSQLGVSRTVLREAVQALAALGILMPRQGDGVYVNSLDLRPLLKPLEFALTLDLGAVEHAYGARLAIEPSIARLAAERMVPELKAELDGLMAQAESVRSDATAFAAIDEDLHGLLARATGNPILMTLMNSLGELARAFRRLTCSVPGAPARALKDWMLISRAIEERNGRAAYEAMERHLANVLQTWQRAREREGRRDVAESSPVPASSQHPRVEKGDGRGQDLHDRGST